jgi:LAO/AO transport system kinase
MVDFFLLLKISGAGDELQGIKRGIMEMADAIVINKADGDNVNKAKLAKTEFKRALHLFPAKSSGWTPIVSTCSSITKEGIDEVWQTITDYFQLVKANHYFEEKRKEQNQYWMMETINDQLKSNFYNHPEIIKLLEENKKAVATNRKSPFTAALDLISAYFK